MKLDDDDFTLFGLPPLHALNPDALDTRWRQLQAEVHPDRFVGAGAATQRLAMQWAVRVNEAYQRLKDPLRRAAYLCEQRGAPIDAERNTTMPASFLQQQMRWREALDDASDAADASAVHALAAEVTLHQQRLLADAQRCLDEQDDAASAAQHVRALMFIARFHKDLARRLDALDPAH